MTYLAIVHASTINLVEHIAERKFDLFKYYDVAQRFSIPLTRCRKGNGDGGFVGLLLRPEDDDDLMMRPNHAT